MRTSIILVTFACLFSLLFLQMVEHTQAQENNDKALSVFLRGSSEIRMIKWEKYSEEGIFIRDDGIPVSFDPKAVSVNIFLLGTANALYSTYLAYMPADFNVNGYSQQVGVYTLTYTYQGASASRTVCVANGFSPSIMLNGNASLNTECGRPFNDPGATASDECEGNLDSEIRVSGEVNTAVLGKYMRTYSVINSLGHGQSIIREVNVVDSVPPVITLKGGDQIDTFLNATFIDPGATANDTCEGKLTKEIEVSGTVDTTKIGSYAIVYSVKDSQGNESVKIRTVNVIYNTEAPVISLNGLAEMTAECGSAFVDPGATATNPDRTRTYPVTSSSLPAEAMSIPGRYVVTYSATNELGNTASVSRTVVVADTVPPVLTLNGSNPLEIDCGTAYIDAGVRSAVDACDGDVTAQVHKTGSVDAASPGNYEIIYTVLDIAGNRCQTTRTIQVRDNCSGKEGEGIHIEGEHVVEGEISPTEGEEEEPCQIQCIGCDCCPQRNSKNMSDFLLLGLSFGALLLISRGRF